MNYREIEVGKNITAIVILILIFTGLMFVAFSDEIRKEYLEWEKKQSYSRDVND